eukprot:9396040-Pyramimonas_sp.AAC.1
MEERGCGELGAIKFVSRSLHVQICSNTTIFSAAAKIDQRMEERGCGALGAINETRVKEPAHANPKQQKTYVHPAVRIDPR